MSNNNVYNLPARFTAKQIQNANRLHEVLGKAGLESYFHNVLSTIIIVTKQAMLQKDLQALLDVDGYADGWKPKIESYRNAQPNAIIFL